MHKHIIARAILLAVMAGGALTGCGEQQGTPQQGQMPPAAVDVVTLKTSSIQITSELSGRTSARRVAEVRPQVGGIVIKRLFTEGSEVKAGQLLYQIDPATYEATVASAEATLAKAKATEQSARLKAERYSELVKARAISQQDYDDADASWKQAVADIASAQATLKSARINLAYTRITAPISGRIGKSSITEGALVTASQTTALATIQQLDPMYVDVTQSTTQLLQLKQQLASGKLSVSKSVPVDVTLEDGTAYPQKGSLQFSDVTVDETTGSVTLRALVPNPDRLLLPGMFVRTTIAEGERSNGLLVPQKALVRTARGGSTVMVVDAQNKVESRDVVVSQSQGQDWVVESGLKAGERVVVAGLQKIKAGAAVNPHDVTDGSAQQGKE
ncbi:membrane fusion protein, multidrug efflux system [Aeromonas sp. RU39B]|uniref:efflux RND transporter periplasmic adaptor subunit n=1 Tax=Aeromonas sp. RU39B TaxID=1907416 RepID=UPI0009550F68|nr:efflux RND transporter periplasmic adaptor subunit [Aeromonas sp. RU39B]SIP90395.1 membrane fusion protein, multidrug efflux system [Aeromonas sp. RU39B]